MHIESWEDRSGAETPSPTSFGFVYFSDGARAGYSSQATDHLPVWQPRTNGGGQYQELTAEQFKMAVDFLYAEHVLTDESIATMKAMILEAAKQ